MWSQRRSVLIQILVTFVGAGFSLLFVSAVAPGFTANYPWVSVFLMLWSLVLVLLLGELIGRLRSTTSQSIEHRKDRYEPGWRHAENAQAKGSSARQAAYSREKMLRQREMAERRAKIEAVERTGVSVSYKPASDERQ